MKPLYQIKDFIPDPNTHKNRWEVYDIKQGGMGWVYIVYDHELRDPFAVKTYKENMLHTEKAKEDFITEALVWINLDRHENVTQARMVQEINNRIYLFLEYVSGGDLSRYVGTKTLDVKQIIKFALQFCYGMEHAFTHGIVCHRDIKPGNCLITEDKTLKITDFGLAMTLVTHLKKIKQEPSESINYSELSRTKTGEWGGTPFYMAPELFDNIKHLDIRSDIYSFGVMLYEMMSGKLPFYGNTWGELKEKHQKENIPDITSAVKKNERLLLDIVYKCMAKQPDNRYTNFSQLVDELTHIYKLLYNENPPLFKIGNKLDSIDLYNKGISLGNLKRYQEEIECYNLAIKIDSSDSKIWYNKGFVLWQLNRNQEAIQCYNKAIEIDPKHTGAWNNKGVILMNFNNNWEALSCYNKVLEIDQKYIDAWYNKGVASEKLGHNSEAIDCYNKALEINPKYMDAWYNKGIVLGYSNRYQEADECFNNILAIDPFHKEVWYNKGIVLGRLNRFQEALSCFNKAIKIDSKHIGAWNNKGVILMDLHFNTEAIECFNKVLEIDSKDCLAWMNKGIALRNLMNFQKAFECYDKAIEIDPAYIDAWYNKGVLFEKLNRHFKAIECFQRARDLGDLQAEQAIAYCQQLIQQQEK